MASTEYPCHHRLVASVICGTEVHRPTYQSGAPPIIYICVDTKRVYCWWVDEWVKIT